jgi:hypothetical protein
MVLIEPFVFPIRDQRVFLDAAHAKLPGPFESVDALVRLAQLPPRRGRNRPSFEARRLLVRIGDRAARGERCHGGGAGKGATRRFHRTSTG